MAAGWSCSSQKSFKKWAGILESLIKQVYLQVGGRETSNRTDGRGFWHLHPWTVLFDPSFSDGNTANTWLQNTNRTCKENFEVGKQIAKCETDFKGLDVCLTISASNRMFWWYIPNTLGNFLRVLESQDSMSGMVICPWSSIWKLKVII